MSACQDYFILDGGVEGAENSLSTYKGCKRGELLLFFLFFLNKTANCTFAVMLRKMQHVIQCEYYLKCKGTIQKSFFLSVQRGFFFFNYFKLGIC